MAASIGLNGSFVHLWRFLLRQASHLNIRRWSPAQRRLWQFRGSTAGRAWDRFTGRRVLPWVLIVLAAGVLLLLGTRNSQTSSIFLVLFLLCYGLTAGVTTAVIPVVLVESLGLRRFGSISGFVGLAGTIGIAGGPLLMG